MSLRWLFLFVIVVAVVCYDTDDCIDDNDGCKFNFHASVVAAVMIVMIVVAIISVRVLAVDMVIGIASPATYM